MLLHRPSIGVMWLIKLFSRVKVDVAGADVSNPTSTDPDPQSTHSIQLKEVAAVPHEITNREEEIYENREVIAGT